MEDNISNNFLLTLTNISKSFGGKVVLDKLSLGIGKNQILVLIGKSGCGKSTLLKILLGVYSPDNGEIIFGKFLDNTELKNIKDKIGFVSQENSFYEKLTVMENLKFYVKAYKNSKELLEKVDDLLVFLKLDYAKNTLAENLSGGMKRRLEIAIALVHNPSILIMDEPFTGLDILIRDEIWEFIKKVKEELGVTILITTHMLTSAQMHSDRIVILNKGRVVSDFLLDSRYRDLNRFKLEVYFKEVL